MVDKKQQSRSRSKPRILTSMQKNQAAKNPDVMKLLHVSIKVISLSGVYFKESTKSKNTDGAEPVLPKTIPKTTVVASLSREEDQEDAVMNDHLRSLPLDLSTPPDPKDATKEVVHWPSSDGLGNGNVSTFQFERYFLREKQGKGRRKKKPQQIYASQSCRIQLAVCRNKRWFKLGDAEIVVSGDERGEQSIFVPLVNKDRPVKKSKNNVIPMARLKGETLKCGLGGNASLRVLVHVSEAPNVEKVVHPNLATVVSWEYDPSIAAVVHKKKSEDEDSIKVVDQAAVDGRADRVQEKVHLLNEVASSKAQVQEEKRKPEDRETITSSVATSKNYESPASKSEIVKVGDLPPVPSIRQSSTSTASRQESLPPIRQCSATSRPQNILDHIMTITNEPASPKAPPPPPTQSSSSRGFSPIRVASPMRTLSPFRALSPLRQSSGGSLDKPSVLDRVVTITSTASPKPSRARSLSEHLASTPAVSKKANGASVYFIEHDMQTSHDVESSVNTSKSIDNTKSRSFLTTSTADKSTSYMSSVKSRSYQSTNSGYSTAGFSRYTTDASSAFTHSRNSAFTTASGYSSTRDSTRYSTDASSMNSRAEDDDRAIVMGELLEMTPSELYAIIHDEDPPRRRRRKDKQRSSEKSSRGKSSRKVVEEKEEDGKSHLSEESEYESEFISAGETSRSTYHESYDEDSTYSSSSEGSISFVNKRRNSQHCKNLTDKAKIFGQRFMCALPMCGVGSDDKTLSYIDDNATYRNGKEYLLGCSKHEPTDTGSSSSSSGRSSVIGSDIVF